MPTRFPGQVAVVTGAASGIGLAISQRLATEGVSVVLVESLVLEERLGEPVEPVAIGA